jgi:hypothetical protein
MDNQTHPLDTLSFEDLHCTSEDKPAPAWSQASTTLYAHPSGELPSRFATVGWQPLHVPGRSKPSTLLSKTLQGLARRATHIVRGEA